MKARLVIVGYGFRPRRLMMAAAVAATLSCGGDGTAAPAAPTPAPIAGPPRPLEGATITITAAGFALDRVSAEAFKIDELRVYQGARLTFVNQDAVPHDVLSDPPHLHTDCPEFKAAGFIVPGQTRNTDPLSRLVGCGFHDHLHEGDSRFIGKVTVETR
jgi:plastocyanin